MDTGYGYFDELYYEDGRQRGTALSGYLANSRQNACFQELARKIHTIFAPKRCLEVGCATGIMVRFLNDLGTEAHGADVSKWATDHREHPNVILTAAESLPFPDDHFDLVYSVHALEHVPTALLPKALAELDRVCSTGIQLHFLPLLEEGPYEGGDRALMMEGLTRDPTHFNILEKPEWLKMWATLGWKELGLRLIFSNDTKAYEISGCHFVLGKKDPSRELVGRVSDSNFYAAKELFYKHQAFLLGHVTLSAAEKVVLAQGSQDALAYDGTTWLDLVASYPETIDLTDVTFRLTVSVETAEPIHLRVALITRPKEGETVDGGHDPHVIEFWKPYPPGQTITFFTRPEMNILRGNPNLAETTSVRFGGQATKTVVKASLVAVRHGREFQVLPQPARPSV
jgi:SAM-dependent methyltransferase